MKNIIFILISLLLLTSCQKEIDLDLEDQSRNIVIEGNITDQPGPYFVKITKSVAFTQPNQYPVIANAVVEVSDNTGQSETLQYMGNGIYQTIDFEGVPGRTYTLKIQAEGKEYTAQSNMPEAVPFEGLEQDSFIIGGKTEYELLPIFTDPPALGNRYLFSISINDKTKKTFQVFSDNINNGMPNQRPLFLPDDDDDEVKVGDIIHVEMQCIDEKIYTFYSALIELSEGGADGGITPANPPSNINNGALGYFSAHTIRKNSIIIQ
ncbi:DUF4249 domain-containing protein [Chryseobacterium potabilaquae]|uniref:DUF4249 domain-containing protein n=1 Tax=Chryseobacterium potabilaquae TaxID=2675057 RepID=A0A6N4X8H6_9FLAO|nr:DUF4249 domain-containing protein [Chryseobacterium potabilaquae]CAA7196535.1 hypothetical protein CHRY9293_02618 [Chryseobacterium potabilaquae]